MVVRTLSADRDADVETYRTIRLASLSTDPLAFGSSYEREIAFGDDDWRRRLGGIDGRPGVTFIDEVTTEAQPLGTAGIGFTKRDPDPMLIGMWVRPEARGTGSGRRLVEAAIDWAKAQHASSVVLWVVQTNDAAIALYRHCGFVPTGTVDEGPDNRCTDELEMRLIFNDHP